MISQLLLSFSLLTTSFCHTSNKILGGHKISIAEVPYQVATFWNSRQSCGGSLISKEFVLSAAHCFDEHVPDKILTVRVGTSTPKDGSGMSINVKYIYNHPMYDTISNDYDFSLLRLYEVKSFPSVVKFAKLPTVYDQLNEGDDVFISGWGRTEFGKTSDVLLRAMVQVQSTESCSKDYQNMFVITERMICARRIGGKVDACQGDSGGPLVRKSDGILFGITSFGCSCGDPRYAGVYANVSSALEWIYETISSDSGIANDQEPNQCQYNFTLPQHLV
ncbi:unnamed protein product [Chironomus riparius]|uniref:trypsin n=1 Tax=Chironomus riparius TaxID=315576 RepID=A0A9N9RTZ2_9DIPT|nr:unnamed protein product [Chironomus riparius]